ncbi:MAG: DoxX family protein [Hyphomicrobiales bacterium]|nr:DoxX family protein [Rickettsiales bacterium]MCP5361075.1 DoxX family protein [Hyphomicrobiales bacterium]
MARHHKELPLWLRVADIKLRVAEQFTDPVILGIRLWLAKVFWTSGTLKLDTGFLGIGQGNWESTLILFEYEYQVPILTPQAAAYLSTAAELIFPILLVLGLGSRIAAFGLLFMTAVIEFTYQHSPEHVIWALFLGTVLTYGPGRIALDFLISRRFLPHRHD